MAVCISQSAMGSMKFLQDGTASVVDAGKNVLHDYPFLCGALAGTLGTAAGVVLYQKTRPSSNTSTAPALPSAPSGIPAAPSLPGGNVPPPPPGEVPNLMAVRKPLIINKSNGSSQGAARAAAAGVPHQSDHRGVQARGTKEEFVQQEKLKAIHFVMEIVAEAGDSSQYEATYVSPTEEGVSGYMNIGKRDAEPSKSVRMASLSVRDAEALATALTNYFQRAEGSDKVIKQMIDFKSEEALTLESFLRLYPKFRPRK